MTFVRQPFVLCTLYSPQGTATNVNYTLVVVKMELGHIRVERSDVGAKLTDL